jgi:Ca2+-binding RTX toxin-like protein
VTITGPDPAEAALDASVPFTITATDPSSVDQAAGFTFTIDWGDGTAIETVDATSPLTVSHSFQQFGEVTVSVTATDKDGGVSAPDTFTLTVVPVAIVGDDLVATGTETSDRIIFYQTNQGIQVRYNNETYPLDGTGYSFSGQIIANGRGGSDQIIVSGVSGFEANFNGGEGNDYLAGGIADDTLDGGTGNDIILGGEGDNVLIGGDGSDRLEGRDGVDQIFGGSGNDRLNGGAGNDILDGGADNDFLFGGLGDDLLAGRGGVDTLNGHFGNDVLFGGSASDQLFGGDGNDLLTGGVGSDRLRGDGGDDTLAGGTSDLESQLEADLDSLLASNGSSGLSPDVQGAIDAWFGSQSDAARSLFEGFDDDSTVDELNGGSGVDTFVVGSNDTLRNVSSEDRTI